MSDPAYRITDFFNKMTNIKSNEEFEAFMRQYWYVWFIISLIIFLMICINIAMIIYFRRRFRPIKKSELKKRDEFVKKTIIIPEKIQDEKPELTTELIGYKDSQFGMDALIANNKYRAMHNVPPLRFNEGLAKMAQNWAENLAKMKKLEHTPNHMRTFNNIKIGENLCYSFNSKLTGDKMIDIWYAESKLHNYKLESQVNTQNFTQLIWRSSKEVGFGRAKSSNGEVWYGVAMYSPSGNVIGKYAENVLPPNI